MKYNPLIHHRRSVRLKGYDYSGAGAYFITICTHNRERLFGKIINGEMALNELGQIAYHEWLKTPELRPNISLDVFVIMPNHMHGIILLDDNRGLSNTVEIATSTQHGEEGVCNTPLRFSPAFRSPSNSIGSVIRGYKAAVTKQINLLEYSGSAWQRNFHEHIIRNEASYQKISNYILSNVSTWREDKFYVE